MKPSSQRLLLMGLLFVFAAGSANAQLRNIRSTSLGRVGGEGAAGYGYVAYLLFDLLTSGVVDWQKATLARRADMPWIVSLDVMGQLAAQPSMYYIINPRVRGNWGIFVTDFRMNYIVEQVSGGFADLRTDDWQILGLNLINERSLTVRLSSGILHERFGAGDTFNESVVGAHWRSPRGKLGALGEYRWAKDYRSGEKPRVEFNCSFYRTVLHSSNFDLSLTVGGVYQVYNSAVPVWGVQGGFLTRIY
jgi:hypothetical protein